MILPLGFGKQCRLVKAGPGKPGPVFSCACAKKYCESGNNSVYLRIIPVLCGQ